VESLLASTWDQLTGRLDGPMRIRFILQPTVALVAAIRAGIVDARIGRTSYLQRCATGPAQRWAAVRDGWSDIGRLFVVAYLIDAIYQTFVLGWFYPLQSLIVAFVLAAVPYVLVRGPAARLARRWRSST
jgi:hypothetical protein